MKPIHKNSALRSTRVRSTFKFTVLVWSLAAAFTSGQVAAATLPVACNPCSTGAALTQPNTGTVVTSPPTATRLGINQASQTAVPNWQSFNMGLGGAALTQPNTGTAVTPPPTATNLTINQTSQTAVRNWQSFNAGLGGNVNFVQPSSNAGTLILAGNGGNPTANGGSLTINSLTLNGVLTANGQIFLANTGIGIANSNTSSLIAGPAYGAVAAVPEPGEWAMMLLGLALIGFITRRRENINLMFRGS